ncbi:hypothetical protein B5X24_HaOG209667 [Helicoverpa armigera]|uniref:Dolichol phosphate-mannose biosynthesis regulatory protein n=1 Tax=Helicoverpa armigera TaxID=29058 RepID=A0A2W1BJB5_HELAM|nr:hypothetical protein B5X24_HaOG209667 [Helicoverpa armigera]
MDIPDALVGKLVLVTTSSVFAVFCLWVNSYPFIDEDSWLSLWLPDPQWSLLLCGAWGLLFVGGLMAFTLYHLYPHLSRDSLPH